MNTPSTRAVKQYNEAVEKADAKYQKIRDRLDREYHATVGPVREKYRAIERRASRIYEKAKAPAWKRYEDTIELPKMLLKQVQKAADDVRMKKLRKAAREKTEARREAMDRLHALPRKTKARITVGELKV